MGIFRRTKDAPTETPGASSQPQGDGPVTLEDRLDGGAPDTNQGKTEPMSPTPDHPEPMAPPTLAEMSVGAADPQAPSHSAATARPPADTGTAPTGLSGPGSDADAQRPVVDSETTTGSSAGPVTPVQQTTGTAHRAPGLQGRTPDGEAVNTDVDGGAGHMVAPGSADGHGDTASAPAAGDGPLAGTSETQPPVDGVRLPEA